MYNLPNTENSRSQIAIFRSRFIENVNIILYFHTLKGILRRSAAGGRMKKPPACGGLLWQGGATVSLPFLPAQVIVQVLVRTVTARLVIHPRAIHAGDGLSGFPTREVIVEITVYNRVILQAHQRLFQVVHGVHHEVVAGGFDTDRLVARPFQGQVREEVHEPLEHAHPVLRPVVRVPYEGDVLALDTSFIIGIAYLIPAGPVPESQGEIVPLPQPVMHLLAEHAAYLHVDTAGMEIREQRMVLQRHDGDIRYLRFDRTAGGRRADAPRRDGSRVPPDVRQHLAHVIGSVEMLPKLHQIAACRRAEVVPFVDAVVHLERRGAFLAQRRQVPVLIRFHTQGTVSQRGEIVHDTQLFCFCYGHVGFLSLVCKKQFTLVREPIYIDTKVN